MADEANESETEQLARMLGDVIVGTIACMSQVVMELSAAGVVDHKIIGRNLKATAEQLKRKSPDEMKMGIDMIERLGKLVEAAPRH